MQQNEDPMEEMLRSSKAVRRETQAFAAAMGEAADQMRQSLDLKGRIERHPWATMAAAAGIGYVIGGGLFTRLTAVALRFGARALLVPLLRAELGSLGELASRSGVSPNGPQARASAGTDVEGM
jgi:hypothetical protein